MTTTFFRPALGVAALAIGLASHIATADSKIGARLLPKPLACPVESYIRLQIAAQLKQRGHLGMGFNTLDLTEGRVGCDAPALMAAIKLYQKAAGCPETGALDQEQLDHLTGKSTVAPTCGKGPVTAEAKPEPPKPADPAAEAKAAFEALNLSEEQLKRSYRGLYRLRFAANERVLTQYADAEFVAAVKAFQKDRRAPETGYLASGQVKYLDSIGEHPFPNEAYQQAEDLWNHGGKDWTVVYNQLAAYLSYNGIEREATTVTREDIKTIQAHAELPPTGYLDQATFDYVAAQPKRFKRRALAEGAQIGDWMSARSVSGTVTSCEISTQAISVEGQFGGPENAYMLFSYDPAWDNSNLHIRFGEAGWFDSGESIKLMFGGEPVELKKADDGNLKPVIKENENSVSTAPFIGLAGSGLVRIEGTSVLGGPLTINFATGGFRRALKDIDRACAKDKLGVWLE